MAAVALNRVRGWTWPLLAGLAVVLALLLWLSPAERTLGQAVKLVYLHGALVRTATLLFAVSLPVNVVALLSGKSSWLAWGRALVWTALAVAARAIRHRRARGALEKAFFSGRGYPRWFLRFVTDDYAR